MAIYIHTLHKSIPYKLNGICVYSCKPCSVMLEPAAVMLVTDVAVCIVTGRIRNCIIGYGSDFDLSDSMEFVVITWPADVHFKTWQELEAQPDFLGGADACRRLFRAGGEPWAPLKDLQTAYRYLDQIETTGVLGLFPMGQPLQGTPRDPVEVRQIS